MTTPPEEGLLELLRSRLSPEDFALVETGLPEPEPEAYDEAIRRATEEALRMSRAVGVLQESADERVDRFRRYPRSQRVTYLQNVPLPVVLVLVHRLTERCYALRMKDPKRALELAEEALWVVDQLQRHERLPVGLGAWVRTEALAHVSNARGINSDLPGSEAALEEAERTYRDGVADPTQEALLCSFRAALHVRQSRYEEAAEAYDAAIAAWEAAGSPKRAGRMLIDRGIVATWLGSLTDACRYVERGIRLVEDPQQMFMALQPVAEGLVRAGRAVDAWAVLCSADAVLELVRIDPVPLKRHRWLKGVTLAALGQLDAAERQLLEVRREYGEERLTLPWAVLTLDLADVYVRQGRIGEVKALAEEAYPVFQQQNVGREAAKAFHVFYAAVQAERITAELTAQVVGFLVRWQRDRRLRFRKGSDP